jgi:Peptidase family M41
MQKNTFDWEAKSNTIKTKGFLRFKSLQDFRHIGAINEWAAQIKTAVLSKSIDQWNLVGHAVVFVHKNEEEMRDLSMHIAHTLEFNFVELSIGEVKEELVNFSLPSSMAPSIIYLEFGEWLKPLHKNKLESEADHENWNLQQSLIKVIRSFDPSNPVIFVLSTADLSEMNPELRQVGIFDRRFELPDPTLQEIGEDFLKLVGLEHCGASLTSNYKKVGKLIDLEFDDFRRQGLVALALKRIASFQGRQVEFIDLVDFAMRGTAEADRWREESEELFNIVAAHEAGHATVAIIDSEHQNIPEYASAFPEKTYNGVVTDSYAFASNKSGRLSYRDYRHKIRVALAGRAAEQLVFGNENVTVKGASSDLEKATSLCRGMFGFYGISSDMENEACGGKNLCVVISEPSPSEMSRVEKMTQEYLENQYQIVFKMLQTHRVLFDSLMNSLRDKRILTQDEISQLIEKNT